MVGIKKITTNRKELHANEGQEYFKKMDIRLVLTIAYNPKRNGKSEHGYFLIIKALIKVFKGKIGDWPKLLLFTL